MATYTAGVVSAAVSTAVTNPNTARYQSYVAGEYTAGAPVATFSSSLFNTRWQPVQNAQGQSMYDIQRSGLETTSQRSASTRQDALSRMLSQQGLQNSGIALKQQGLARQNEEQNLMSGLVGINVAELSAAEQARLGAMQRQYGAETLGVQNAQQTGERLGTQAYGAGQQTEQLGVQKELTYADLSLREQQIANQASQFTSDLDFKKWATDRGYTEAEADRAWKTTESAKDRATTIETVGMQTGSSERIAKLNVASNERLSANKDAIAQQGLTLDAARLYGYTDPVTGQHITGEMENAANEFGLKEKTLDLQQQELWGWTDDKGVRHDGKYNLLSKEDKREADKLYGFTTPSGTHIRGSLENDQLITDLKERETMVGVDSFYGYTDPKTGEYIEGSGSIAAKAFGLKSKEFDLQQAELFGAPDPKTGEWVPGKMALLSNDDRRAADALYGYTDAMTGMHVMGTLEIQADKNAIERQGLTLATARTMGYTDDKGVFHPGEIEMAEISENNKKTLLELDYMLKAGLLDKQQVLDTDKAIQKAKADRYFLMGKNGEPIEPQELAHMAANDPLAYQSYLMGKEGKSSEDLARAVQLSDDYRAAQITNMDDPDIQETVTKMFASWGVVEAEVQQDADEARHLEDIRSGNAQARDFTDIATGRSVVLDAPTIATNGVEVPAGHYEVTRVEETRTGAWDQMKQDTRQDKGTVTYLVAGDGTRIEVKWEVTEGEKEGDWWENCANPLSSSFWEHPFGIKW